jgi:hypothetical protein
MEPSWFDAIMIGPPIVAYDLTIAHLLALDFCTFAYLLAQLSSFH